MTMTMILLMKIIVNVNGERLEEERDANVWSPNVQQITEKMASVLAAVTRKDVVREHQKLHIVST